MRKIAYTTIQNLDRVLRNQNQYVINIYVIIIKINSYNDK